MHECTSTKYLSTERTLGIWSSNLEGSRVANVCKTKHMKHTVFRNEQIPISTPILVVSLNVNCSVESPTLSANLTVFVIPCKFWGGLLIYSVATTVTYQVVFIQISNIHDNISSYFSRMQIIPNLVWIIGIIYQQVTQTCRASEAETWTETLENLCRVYVPWTWNITKF